MLRIALRSPTFPPGGSISARPDGDREDRPPPLEWGVVPAFARELVLTCEDLDAPRGQPSHHWIVYSIPARVHALREGDQGSVTHGTNDFGHLGYTGPQSPGDHGVHHYRFRLSALDASLNLQRGLRWRELQDRMRGHVVAEGELIGTYEKP